MTSSIAIHSELDQRNVHRLQIILLIKTPNTETTVWNIDYNQWFGAIPMHIVSRACRCTQTDRQTAACFVLNRIAIINISQLPADSVKGVSLPKHPDNLSLLNGTICSQVNNSIVSFL